MARIVSQAWVRRSVGTVFIVLPFLMGLVESASAGDEMRKRVQRVKESTVRILVNGIAAGTGFAVATNLVATNFHVVQQLSSAGDGKTQVAYAGRIEVELYDGRRFQATPHASVATVNLQTAIGRDIALLSVPVNDLRPLPLGRFADVAEGDRIYLAGYPFGIEQVVIATGLLSTKWTIGGYLGQGGPRSVAWLDITMNKGNSGGPVLMLTENPARDAVVGIANFSLNPFAERAEDFAKIAASFSGQGAIMGVDFKKFSGLIGQALASQSHGVGGCLAIDYVQLPKP